LTFLFMFVFLFLMTLFTVLGIAIVVPILEAIFNSDKYMKRGEEVAPILVPFIAWSRLIKGLFKKKRYN
jgi:hypothetical protein